MVSAFFQRYLINVLGCPLILNQGTIQIITIQWFKCIASNISITNKLKLIPATFVPRPYF